MRQELARISKSRALLVGAAAVAAVALAVTEGARYDGWVRLHPMHPVHLYGPGGYRVMPLAWVDPETAAWSTRAVVRPNEGPWQPLGRAPLDRHGFTYSVLGGAGQVVSGDDNTTSFGEGDATSTDIDGDVKVGAGGGFSRGGDVEIDNSDNSTSIEDSGNVDNSVNDSNNLAVQDSFQDNSEIAVEDSFQDNSDNSDNSNNSVDNSLTVDVDN